MPRLERLTPMLQVPDLQRTIDFYTGVLGFRVRGLWPEERPSWCELGHGDVRLRFYTDDAEPEEPKQTGLLYFDTDDVFGLLERVKGRARVLWGPEVFHYGMHEFAIADCNGYTLSFGQPTDAPPTCPEP